MADYPVLDDTGGTIIAHEKDPNYVPDPYDRSGDYPVLDDQGGVIVLTDRDPILGGGGVAPAITGVPTVAGTAEVGQTLTATPASVTGTPTPTRTMQWLRNGSVVATGLTYVIQPGDEGFALSVRQQEVNAVDIATATSVPTAVVTNPNVAPSISGLPTIAGSTVEGQTLTATPASVTGSPAPARTWQWLRDGVAIAGATAAAYLLVSADVGTAISVRQTETNASGSDSATSTATNTITAAPVAPVLSGVPTIAGSPVQGQTLTATPSGFSNTPNPTPTRLWAWLRSGVVIPGTDSPTYTLVAADVGETISVRQTETNSGGSDNATSTATAAVTEPAPTLTGYTFNEGTGQVSFTVDVGDTVFWSTTVASETDPADIENAVAAVDSGNNPVASGVNNFTWSYPSTSGNHYLNIVVKNATGYSNVISVQYNFTAPGDVTPPILSGAVDASNGQTASTGSVSTNEGNGTLYSVATTSSTAPTAAQVKLGQDHTGSAATSAVSQAVSATGVQAVNHTGLTAATQYYTHYMHEDAASNQSTVVSASGFTTDAAGSPELLQEPGFDASTTWFPPGGCTIQNSAAEWRTAGAFSTLWNGISVGNMAAVSGSTSYTVAFDVANFVNGGNFQLGVTWYDSGGVAINTDEAAVAANANGTVSRVLGDSPANAAYASYRAKPWGADYNLDFPSASLKAT